MLECQECRWMLPTLVGDSKTTGKLRRVQRKPRLEQRRPDSAKPQVRLRFRSWTDARTSLEVINKKCNFLLMLLANFIIVCWLFICELFKTRIISLITVYQNSNWNFGFTCYSIDGHQNYWRWGWYFLIYSGNT